MTINALKLAIAEKAGIKLPTLMMVRQMELAADGTSSDTATPWLSHWENDSRVRISMHQDVMEKIKGNPQEAGLAFKYEEVPATKERLAYRRFIVITPNHVEATF